MIDMGYRQISEQAKEDGTGKKHEPLLLETVIKEPGYVYSYVSNESAGSEVFFDDMQVSQSSNTATQFVLKDHLGSTRMLLSESNQVLIDYDYDVYGKTVSATASTVTPYVGTYTGQEYEWRFSLYNYGARFYDAELGRFLATDPVRQIHTLYKNLELSWIGCIRCGSRHSGVRLCNKKLIFTAMPTVLSKNGFKFFFYSAENDEPCHIHVKKGEGDGKIWLEPEIKEEYLEDFKTQQKTQIRKIIKEHRDYFIEKWYEYFQDKN